MDSPPLSTDDIKRALSPTEEIIEEAREGRMVILVDAEDRENEGDLVIPAQFATPGVINFMAKHGRGLICLALTDERSDALGLQPMVSRNQTRMGTAFTVSIEAKEGITTGISAHDRAHTIAVAIDPSKTNEDIVSPGHVFPLRAREGGVLVRAGHTEASIDIARLAGLAPAAVICEIMNDDGTMARLPELTAFAQFHNLKIGTISDLIAHRRVYDHYVERVLEEPFEVRGGTGFKLHVFRNKLDGMEHIALVKGEIKSDEPVLVRVHRMDFTADVLGGFGRRSELVQKAIEEIDAEGAGVLVMIRELQPDSISRRILNIDSAADDDRALRVIGIGSLILREVGVRKMVLLADAPVKLVGVEGYGLSIEGWRSFRS